MWPVPIGLSDGQDVLLSDASKAFVHKTSCFRLRGDVASMLTRCFAHVLEIATSVTVHQRDTWGCNQYSMEHEDMVAYEETPHYFRYVKLSRPVAYWRDSSRRAGHTPVISSRPLLARPVSPHGFYSCKRTIPMSLDHERIEHAVSR